MCRSLPPISIIFFNNSLSVIPAIAHLQFYKTVSRRTSSMVVCPSATFIKPLRRSVIIPCSIAFFFNSRAEAPTRINDELRELILVGASALELKKKAIEQGMITLRRSGLMKVALGQTTMEEVLRETVL